MPVRYITVTPVTKLFKPATRAFGDIAVVGAAEVDAKGPKKTPIPITNPDSLSPNVKTTLSADINTTVTTVSVASAVGFPLAPFNVRIDSEIMQVTAMTGTNFTVTRGASETSAAEHKSGALVVFPSGDKQVEDADWFKGDLGNAIRKAFEQTPGPTTVWAVRTDTADGADALKKALTEVAKLDVQIVVLANRPLKSATDGKDEIELLSSHVTTVSNNGGDGKERIGVAML